LFGAIFPYSLQALLLFPAIGSPFKGNKPSIHTETVKDGGGRDSVKDLSPIGTDKICRDECGGYFGSFGDDLKEGVGLFLGR
jgi:hypothetical protein